ncbi:hypothetical protein D3C78_1841800 [compost metagenome]
MLVGQSGAAGGHQGSEDGLALRLSSLKALNHLLRLDCQDRAENSSSYDDPINRVHCH